MPPRRNAANPDVNPAAGPAPTTAAAQLSFPEKATFSYSQFKGWKEPDVHEWLDNFNLICTTKSLDPVLAFPSYCDVGPLTDLRRANVEFTRGTWNNLRRVLVDTYAEKPNKTALTSMLFNRRQAPEESVAEYAGELNRIVNKLEGYTMDHIIGQFINGLRDDIANFGMINQHFSSFKEALVTAKIIETNMTNRRQRAAVPLKPSSMMTATEPVDETPPAWLTAVINTLDSHTKQGPARHQRSGGYRSKPYQHRPALQRLQQKLQQKQQQPQQPQQPQQQQGEAPIECAFCKMTNHNAEQCRLRLTLLQRLNGRPFTYSMCFDASTDLGPLLTTNRILLNGLSFTSLIDSGATASFVRKEVADQLMAQSNAELLGPSPMQFKGGNGALVEHHDVIKVVIAIASDLPPLEQTFFVSNSVPFDVVLGTNALSSLGVLIDPAFKRLIFDGGRRTLNLQPVESSVLDASLSSITEGLESLNLEDDIHGELIIDVDLDAKKKDIHTLWSICPELQLEQQQRIQQLLSQYKHIFEPASGFEPCEFPPFRVDTGSHPPIASRPFRIPYAERDIISAKVQEYLQRGWIQKSNSCWSSPTMIVRRNGKERWCVDYRKLNAVTVPDRFPAPHVLDCLDAMSKCKFFSICDADNAYHQCLVDQDDADKLAFVTHEGIFTPRVLLFGPRNAPAYFQRHMSATVCDLPHCNAYLDDLTVFTGTFDEHINALEALFARLSERKLRLKPSKCHFGMSAINYLGYVVDADGVRTNPEKVAAIANMLPPTSVSELRRFMGACGYYQQFIPNFAELASPLYKLTIKGTNWTWSNAQQHAFDQLKLAITSEPVLQLPDLERTFEVLTDASNIAIGAVLQQRDDNGDPHPVAYASRTLQEPETRYFTQELECLAVVYALLKFHTYLFGRHFYLYTDHKALESVLTKPSLSARITRWSLAMQQYDFDIIHVPGRSHFVPDALSRPTTMCTIFSSDEQQVQEWLKHQIDDPFCFQTIQHVLEIYPLGDEDTDDITGFRLSDRGILVLTSATEPTRVVVPQTLVPAVMKEVHDSPMGAHQGINRTIKRVAASYFWPGFRRDVADYVDACMSCQQRKGPPTRNKKLPTLHIFGHAPNDLVALDLMGPFPRSVKGMTQILVIQDLFSKYVQTIGILDASAQSVSEAFVKHWVGPFGPPQRLLSDNGGAFTSTEFDDLIGLLKVQKLWTSPYRPQTDGSVERFNRTLLAMLSHYTNEQQDNWDENLHFLSVAYNSTYNYTIDSTPYYVFFGRPVPSASEQLTMLPNGQHSNFGQKNRQAMRLALRVCYDNIIRRQRELLNESATAFEDYSSYQLGDSVLIFAHYTPAGATSKLRRQWTGPYVVTDISGPLSYVVTSIRDSTKQYRVHAEHMKPVRGPYGQSAEWPKQQVFSQSALKKPLYKKGRSTNRTIKGLDSARASGVSSKLLLLTNKRRSFSEEGEDVAYATDA